jgi:hypothetical protein
MNLSTYLYLFRPCYSKGKKQGRRRWIFCSTVDLVFASTDPEEILNSLIFSEQKEPNDRCFFQLTNPLKLSQKRVILKRFLWIWYDYLRRSAQNHRDKIAVLTNPAFTKAHRQYFIKKQRNDCTWPLHLSLYNDEVKAKLYIAVLCSMDDVNHMHVKIYRIGFGSRRKRFVNRKF